ncbi:MAG: Hsp20/alpha crystallin family protein [Chloroflexi bacterium]|nr:Hsp20/alpha crystallin family protein [Chloroflexota bacterium]
MGNLVRWEPFRDLTDVRFAMDRMFDRSFARPWPMLRWEPALAQVAIDLYETADVVGVTASLPGVKAEDVQVSVTGKTLTIRGETKASTEENEGNYYRQERRSGAFQRVITLPVRVEADKAEATFEDGVLKLELPKVAEVKATTIEVKAKKVVEAEAS